MLLAHSWPPFSSALEAASSVVVVVGEPPYAEGGGDRRELELSPSDASIIAAVANGVRRVVVVLLCGRPLAIPPATLELIDALVVAWLPGTEGGGVADVLFGSVPFSGRLSFSWPAHAHQMTKEERSAPRAAQYPLGFGLSL